MHSTISTRLFSALGIVLFLSGCTAGFSTSKVLEINSGLSNGQNGVAPQIESVSINAPEEMSYTKGILQLKGDCVSGRSIHFAGTGTLAVPDLVCENGSFSQSLVLTAGDGIKNVIASQALASGRVSTAARSFQKDSTPPSISFLAPAVSSAFKSSLVLSGACEAGLRVQIYGPAVAADSSTPCGNGSFQMSIDLSVGDGTKSVYIAQTDLAGNVGSSARIFLRDSTSPVVTINSPAVDSNVSSGLTLIGTCETGLALNVSGSGLAAPVSAPCVSMSYSVPIVVTEGNGAKIIQVSQTDAAGNSAVGVTRTFNRTGVTLAVAIQQPLADSFVGAAVTLAGSCVTGLTVKISGTGVATPVNTSCTSTKFTANLTLTSGDGLKNVIASQTDASGNTGQASRSFMLDATAPNLAIAAPTANTATKESLAFVGSCEAGLPITVRGAGVSAADSIPCTSGMFNSPIKLSANDGSKLVELLQTDAGGNQTLKSVTVIRDNVAPQIEFQEPLAGTIARQDITVKGTCEAGLSVTISGSGAAAPVASPCAASVFTSAVALSAGDGPKIVTISQEDRAGNKTSVNREFVRGAPPEALDGAALYTMNCAGCHGSVALSTKRGRSAPQITTAIKGIPIMAGLSSLSAAQVAAISSALSASVPVQICSAESTQKAALRRLNSREFANSVRDVLGVTVNQTLLPLNDFNGSGYDTDGSALRLSDLDSKKYLDVLQAALTTLFAAAPKTGFDYTCANTASEQSSRSCTSTKLALLARRALKKNLTAAEIARYVDFAKKDSDVTEGLKSAMTAMLMSPYFLYLNAEPAAAVSGAKVLNVNNLELAHRLALMIWSSVPDDALITLALSGKIQESATLREQVVRMVADAKFKTGLGQGFVDSWLELYKLNGITRTDPSISTLSDAYLKDMAEESRLFVQYLFKNDRPVSEVLTAQYSFLNQRLAQVYGVSGTFSATTFTMTSVPATQRSGVMTQPSVLTLTGKLDSTSPVKRGFWMTKRILCSEPPPPPPNIPVFDSEGSSGLTIKQRLAEHRTNVSCAGCHTQMDPVGIGLENFSQIGRWRTSYGSTPVDATESFDTTAFNGPVELGKILAPREDVKACITSQIATYALGRATSTDDACYIREILTKTESSSSKGFLTLLQEMVDSPLFKQHRLGN